MRLERRYVSSLRGEHALGSVRLRIEGPLGLLWRQARVVGSQGIAVHPALENLSATLRLAASERWRDLGVRLMRRRGGLTEFESLREYVPGDDVRTVDWKAFAKRGHPNVRQYQVERGQELLILIDTGRRMGATTTDGEARGWTKLDHALDAALQLAAVALMKGDRVGMLAFDSGVRAYVPPRRGQRQMEHLREGVFDLLPSARDSDLGRALRAAAVRLRRRALVLVVSDVGGPALDRPPAQGAHPGRRPAPDPVRGARRPRPARSRGRRRGPRARPGPTRRVQAPRGRAPHRPARTGGLGRPHPERAPGGGRRPAADGVVGRASAECVSAGG